MEHTCCVRKKRHNLFVPSSCAFVRVCECYLSPWIVVDWASHIWQQRKSNSIADVAALVRTWVDRTESTELARQVRGAKKKISSELNDSSDEHDQVGEEGRPRDDWKRMMLALSAALPKPLVWCFEAIKLKQIVPIKCREKWKNSIHSKSECLMCLPRHYIASRPITFHFMCILIGFCYFLCSFAIWACCILNLRATEN